MIKLRISKAMRGWNVFADSGSVWQTTSWVGWRPTRRSALRLAQRAQRVMDQDDEVLP